MDELLEQFLIEGPELAQQAAADLLALERSPDDAARLDGAFRAVHTLKGSVALFDLAPMGLVLHAAEDLLEGVRAGDRPLSREAVDALMACIDQCEGWMDALAVSAALPEGADTRAGQIAAALRRAVGAEGAATPPAGDEAAPDWAAALRSRHGEGAAARTAVRYRPHPEAYFRGDDPLAIALSAPGLLALEIEADPAGEDYDPFLCTLRFALLSEAPAEAVAAALRLVADQADIVGLPDVGDAAEGDAPAGATPAAEAATARSLRIDPARVDALAGLVDELVVAKNALAAIDPAAPREALARALRRSQAEIDRLTAALHRAATGMRLTPLAPVLHRLERLGRDTAARLGKTVALEVSGHAVEADKGLVDGLYEPLLHLLRNALDHGVETPQERRAAGKPEQARIRLAARQQGDAVIVEIADDGRGVDAARVRRTALARGLAAPAALEAMDETAVLELLFAPGFSTATTVSALSGRGVGMDAVRTAVTGLGGRVVMSSRPGEGATVALTLPLTMALTRVLVVEAAGERFAIPMQGVEETVAVRTDRVTPIRHGRAFVHRGGTVPLVALSQLLALPSADRDEAELKVLVAEAAGERVGIAVDRIVNRMDVVMRPVSGLLAGTPGLAGATLTGDGAVLMILDLPGLIG